MRHQFTGLNFLDPMNGVVHDPASLMALGMSAGTAGGIGAAASILTPILSIAGAAAEMSAANAQAAEYEREAKEARVAGHYEASAERRRTRQSMAAERGAMIEGGAYSGTSLGLEAQNVAASELDALLLEYRGTQHGRSAEFSAAQARRSASPLKLFTAAVSGFSNFDPLNLAPGGGAIRRGGVSSSPRPMPRPGGAWYKGT